MDLYSKVSDEVEDLRMYCAALPPLSVAWARLLIAHAELMHTLWRSGEAQDPDAAVAARRLDHADCVDRLRARCRHYLAQSQAELK
jgi:hypothetical protein